MTKKKYAEEKVRTRKRLSGRLYFIAKGGRRRSKAVWVQELC